VEDKRITQIYISGEIGVIGVPVIKDERLSALLQSSVSHDPSEIILVLNYYLCSIF